MVIRHLRLNQLPFTRITKSSTKLKREIFIGAIIVYLKKRYWDYKWSNL